MLQRLPRYALLEQQGPGREMAQPLIALPRRASVGAAGLDVDRGGFVEVDMAQSLLAASGSPAAEPGQALTTAHWNPWRLSSREKAAGSYIADRASMMKSGG